MWKESRFRENIDSKHWQIVARFVIASRHRNTWCTGWLSSVERWSQWDPLIQDIFLWFFILGRDFGTWFQNAIGDTHRLCLFPMLVWAECRASLFLVLCGFFIFFNFIFSGIDEWTCQTYWQSRSLLWHDIPGLSDCSFENPFHTCRWTFRRRGRAPSFPFAL